MLVNLILLGISLVLTGLYTYSWVQYTINQFKERDWGKAKDNPELSRRWHRAKALNQLLFFFLIFILFGQYIAVVNILVYWIFFDGFINKLYLNKPFFDVGETAKTDIFVQKLVKLCKGKVSEKTVVMSLKLILLLIALILTF